MRRGVLIALAGQMLATACAAPAVVAQESASPWQILSNSIRINRRDFDGSGMTRVLLQSVGLRTTLGYPQPLLANEIEIATSRAIKEMTA